MSEEKISEALNIEYEPSVKKITIIDKKELQKIKREKRENLLHGDFETARQNIKDMIHTGMEAVDGIMKVAIAGLGGLGSMAVKFAVAFGCHVTVISRGTAKKAEAISRLGAHNFIDSTDPE